MDLHHSPPRRRFKSFHAVSQDTAEFAHPVHAETVPNGYRSPRTCSSRFLYFYSLISPEERRVITYARSTVPASNAKDTTAKGLFPYRMPKLCDEHLDRYIDGLEKDTNQPVFARTASKTLVVFYCNESVDELSLYCDTFFSLNKSQMPQIYELVALADKMKLEIHMHLLWRDFIGLAKVTAPLRDAGFELSVTFNEERSDIPSQYRDFHKALAVKAITGSDLDAANLRF
ncbi:hypothetical protein F52700_1997 [Fusarium sp. NRRL 52700]|nr:hypothetical protein F52700_1997 [Fusarium sp. NRRL 52700]